MKHAWPFCLLLMSMVFVGRVTASEPIAVRSVSRVDISPHAEGGSCGPDGRSTRGAAGEMHCVDNEWQYLRPSGVGVLSIDVAALYSLEVRAHGRKLFEVRSVPSLPGGDGSIVVCVSSRASGRRPTTSVYTVGLTQVGDGVEVILDDFRKTVRGFGHGAVALSDGDKTVVVKVLATFAARSAQGLAVRASSSGLNHLRPDFSRVGAFRS
jgi:hypothetical protein